MDITSYASIAAGIALLLLIITIVRSSHNVTQKEAEKNKRAEEMQKNVQQPQHSDATFVPNQEFNKSSPLIKTKKKKVFVAPADADSINNATQDETFLPQAALASAIEDDDDDDDTDSHADGALTVHTIRKS